MPEMSRLYYHSPDNTGHIPDENKLACQLVLNLCVIIFCGWTLCYLFSFTPDLHISFGKISVFWISTLEIVVI